MVCAPGRAAPRVRVLDEEHHTNPGRLATEAIIQRNMQAIGIKLDIQNYPGDTFFGSLLPGGKASPPTGAVAGRYDIAEFGKQLWL